MTVIGLALFSVGTILILALPVIVTVAILGLVAWLINHKSGR